MLSAHVYAQILYNAAHAQYVLLFHADTVAFDYNVVGVAVSAGNITGPYEHVRVFHPDGLNSLDMGVFQVRPLSPMTGTNKQPCTLHLRQSADLHALPMAKCQQSAL